MVENFSSTLLKASLFAAEKHQFQRRRGYDQLPYINHLIKVANLLLDCGEDDPDLLIAALLHDSLEDTDATEQEIADLFGQEVLKIVKEMTDNMSLPYDQRKQLQIEKAGTLLAATKKLKIADKICNIRDIMAYPLDWTIEEKIEYIEWSERVINQLKGVSKTLEDLFDHEVRRSKETLQKIKSTPSTT